MLDILGVHIKPKGVWVAVDEPDGGGLACSICGNLLPPAEVSMERYVDDDGNAVEETVELFLPVKYCPVCHSRMLNYLRLKDMD